MAVAVIATTDMEGGGHENVSGGDSVTGAMGEYDGGGLGSEELTEPPLPHASPPYLRGVGLPVQAASRVIMLQDGTPRLRESRPCGLPLLWKLKEKAQFKEEKKGPAPRTSPLFLSLSPSSIIDQPYSSQHPTLHIPYFSFPLDV